MAREYSSGGARRGREASGQVRHTAIDAAVDAAVEAASEKIAYKAARQAAKVRAKAARHAEQLDRLAEHLEALDVWTRVEPSRRRPRLSREEIAATAVRIADDEGLDALSMRRLAAELGISPMSLYRHVANKDDLVAQMADTMFGEGDLPDPGPEGWRAKLELVSRLQWHLLRRHLWLARVISFTRPLLVPNAMAHTEWTLRALDGLGLSMETRAREAITLPALAVTTALSLAAEVEAGQESGVTFQQWWHAREERTAALLASRRFPLLATLPQDIVTDLDGLFEHTLARHLDGLAALVNARKGYAEVPPS